MEDEEMRAYGHLSLDGVADGPAVPLTAEDLLRRIECSGDRGNGEG